jgi:drug/metabolite transporter (DMT)-like permease
VELNNFKAAFFVVIAIIYGYLIWGDQPTFTMLAGATIIVLSGIILVATEKRRNRAANLAPQSQ